MAKKTPARKAPSPARARVRFSRTGPTLTGRQLGVMEGRLCVFKLPEEHRRFLRKWNGGDPEPSHFPWVHPTEGEQRSHVDNLLGLDPRPLDDLARGVDCFHVALKFRGTLPGLSVPIGFADRDNVLLLFEHGPKEGEVWIKVMDEVPLGVEHSDPNIGLYFVAPSFNAFPRLLCPGE